jgi:hypothetical protein
MPIAYPANTQPGRIRAYTMVNKKCEQQQRVKADLHSAICSSLGTVILNEVNSKHQFGTGSLSPLDLVVELKAMFGNVTKQKIGATQALISVPLGHFLDSAISAATFILTMSFSFLPAIPSPSSPALTRFFVHPTLLAI